MHSGFYICLRLSRKDNKCQRKKLNKKITIFKILMLHLSENASKVNSEFLWTELIPYFLEKYMNYEQLFVSEFHITYEENC